MEGLEDRVPVTEERAGAVVALTPSSKFSFFAMATLPKHAYLHDMALTRWIVGVTGALAGLLVFTVIFWQSRRALDLHAVAARHPKPGFLSGLPTHRGPAQRLGGRRGLVALAPAIGRRAIGGHLHSRLRTLRPVRGRRAMVFDLARQDIPVIAAQAPDFYVSLNLAPSELCSGRGAP